MSAQPVDDYDPDDPMEIMRALPARYHEKFLADYDAAAAGARRPEQYWQLHHLLRLWRLRAAAYSDPEFDTRLEAARLGSEDQVPIEQVIPDWSERLAEARQQRGEQ